MTVAELIKVLQKLTPSNEVYVVKENVNPMGDGHPVVDVFEIKGSRSIHDTIYIQYEDGGY